MKDSTKAKLKAFLEEYSWFILLGVALLPLMSYFSTGWKIMFAFCYLVLVIGYQPGYVEPHDPSLDEPWDEDDEWTC